VNICIASGASVDVRHPMKLVTIARYDQHKAAKQYGFTPLMYAAQGGYMDIVNTLLEARASVGATDEDGTMPLMLSVSAGEFEVSKVLIAAGADTEARDDDGKEVREYLPEDVLKDPPEARKWRTLLTGVAEVKVGKKEHAAATSSPTRGMVSHEVCVGSTRANGD